MTYSPSDEQIRSPTSSQIPASIYGQLSQRLVGRCPFHTDAQPSLVVYPKDASYYCFGCGVGGDVIDFVSRLNGVGVPARRYRCCQQRPLTSSPRRHSNRRESAVTGSGPGPPTEAELPGNRCRCRVLPRSLSGAVQARSRTSLLRGIDRRIAEGKARLDIAVQVWPPPSAIADSALRPRAASAGSTAKWESMVGRIIIADIRDGRATWLTGRTLGEATPRYMNLRLPTPLLGLASVGGEEAVILAEGVFDWLTLVQWGFPAVALLGTRVSKHTVETLRRFSGHLHRTGLRRRRPARLRGTGFGSRRASDHRRVASRSARPERPWTLNRWQASV